MQDLLVVWDAIFADSVGFELVDFIFVAMLLYLREACKFSRSKSTLFQKTLWNFLIVIMNILEVLSYIALRCFVG